METTHCKNCGAPVDGPFCGQCGQKVITKRLTTRNAFGQLFDAITNLDRGFWFTMWEMTVRPGKVIKEYISGITRPYFPPFRYAFILVTISAILMVTTGIFDNQQAEYTSFQGENPEQTEAIQNAFQDGMKRFLNFFIIIILPFYALGTWMFTRKYKFNYAEHFVANTFITGQSSVYGLFLLPFYILWPPFVIYSFPISIMMNSVILMLVFNQWMGMEKGEGMARGLLATIVANFIMLFSIMAIAVAVVVIMAKSGLL